MDVKNDKMLNSYFIGKWFKLLDLLTEIDSTERAKDIREEDLRPFINSFVGWCPPHIYEKVLNIGCGTGLESVLLINKGYKKVFGINYDEEIDYPKEWLSFYQYDMHNLQLFEKYDAIFCLQTLEHALAPFLVILEFRRNLVDQGRVFIDLPDPDDEVMLQSLQHTSVLYPNQWKALFHKAGFKLIHDLTVKHRLDFVFEKLPLEKIREENIKSFLEKYLR